VIVAPQSGSVASDVFAHTVDRLLDTFTTGTYVRMCVPEMHQRLSLHSAGRALAPDPVLLHARRSETGASQTREREP
jgi:hypothetical protein